MGQREDEAAARAAAREAERQRRLATGQPAARVLPAALAKAKQRAGEN